MTILLLGFMLGLGDKLRWMLRSYLIVSCGCGLFFMVGSQANAALIGNYCGDARVAGTEACDDGNNTNGDGCDYNCHFEAGQTQSGATGSGTIVSSGTATTTTAQTGTAPKATYSYYKVLRPGVGTTSNKGGMYASLFTKLGDKSRYYPKYVLTPFFQGNLPIVYQYIGMKLAGLSTEEQYSKLDTFVTNIKKMNANLLLIQYNLDLMTIVDVVEAVMNHMTTPSLNSLVTTNNAYMPTGPIPLAKDGLIKTDIIEGQGTIGGSPVALSIVDMKEQIMHIDRHIANASYGCTYKQCDNVVRFIPSGTQTITAYITVQNGAAYTDTVTIKIP